MSTFPNELQQVLHDVGKRRTGNGIKPKSAQRYFHRVIQRVNREEEEAEGQKRKMRAGMVKVSGLSHKREKQSDPRIAWFVFHKIYCMYSNINNKEEINAAIVLTRIVEQEEAKKVNEELKDSRENDKNNQHFLRIMIINSDLNYIQPRATQV